MKIVLTNKGNKFGSFYPVDKAHKGLFQHCTGGYHSASKESLLGMRLVFENHGIELEADFDECPDCQPRCAAHYGDPG